MTATIEVFSKPTNETDPRYWSDEKWGESLGISQEDRKSMWDKFRADIKAKANMGYFRNKGVKGNDF